MTRTGDALVRIARAATLGVALAGASTLLVAVAAPRYDALLIADGAGDRYDSPWRVFVEPFPDRISCELQAHEILAIGRHARCETRTAAPFGEIARSVASLRAQANLRYVGSRCSAIVAGVRRSVAGS